jgi:hypothetical protein
MSDCATWWIDHVGQTYFYVIATRQGDPKGQMEAAEKLVQGAEEWGRLIELPQASQLMLEHVGALKTFVDSAFAGEKTPMDASLEALLANVDRQADLYGASFKGFPTEDFRRLFARHVVSTGGYVLALIVGDAEGFKKDYSLVILDRNALARLWGLLCPLKKNL